MKVGLILIGDELLNGSRQDKHMASVIGFLKKRGMMLSWVRMLGDDREQLIKTLRETMQTPDLVFSCGGIGATPDDLTRECAAMAADVPLAQHSEAKQLIENKFGEAAYPNRILMSELPQNSVIIPNPVNQVPGFSVNHHHFVPGFPDMAWPMIEWVLDSYYKEYFQSSVETEIRWDICNTPESELLDVMNALLKCFPGVRLSSLPSTANRSLIDFGLKGNADDLKQAAHWLEKHLRQHGVNFKRRIS
jgi:molybdopterin-biosynthesis enzyme MoeA-like protein